MINIRNELKLYICGTYHMILLSTYMTTNIFGCITVIMYFMYFTVYSCKIPINDYIQYYYDLRSEVTATFMSPGQRPAWPIPWLTLTQTGEIHNWITWKNQVNETQKNPILLPSRKPGRLILQRRRQQQLRQASVEETQKWNRPEVRLRQLGWARLLDLDEDSHWMHLVIGRVHFRKLYQRYAYHHTYTYV